MINCRKIRDEASKNYFELTRDEIGKLVDMTSHVTRRCESVLLGASVVGDEKNALNK